MRETGRDSAEDGERGSDESPGVSAMRRARRRWSVEEKARVVRESFRAGKRVGEVARRYGVSRWQLSAWRSLARAGKLAVPASAQPEPVEAAPAHPETRQLVAPHDVAVISGAGVGDGAGREVAPVPRYPASTVWHGGSFVAVIHRVKGLRIGITKCYAMDAIWMIGSRRSGYFRGGQSSANMRS